MNTALQL